MKWIAQFARFWYDFIVGDDWTVAVVVIVAVAISTALAHRGWTAWPVVPVAAAGGLALSIMRGARATQRAGVDAGHAPTGESAPPC